MISTADQLLAALEPLPHAARLRFTAVTAHRLAAGGGLRPLLTALAAGSPYERRLAALAALTGGEPDHLVARLGDPDPVVRRYALRGARRLSVPDAAVEAAYDDAPAVVRADLARLLRDGRRPGLAERLVLRVRGEYGDRDAARLLPGCSTEFTARLLPELAGALAFEGWSTLAVRHPAAVLDHAERELGGIPQRLRDLWWRRHAAGIAAALPAAPGRVLDLLERYGPDNLPGPLHDRLGDLVAVDAERVVRWFAAPDRTAARWERTPGRAVMRQLVAADPPSLPTLGARWFHREAFGVLLRSMPPGRRARFVDAVVAAGDPRGNVRAHAGVIAPLPPSERHARARAAIDAVRAEPHAGWDLWGLLALLPAAEARPELLAGLGTDDADERGTIWYQLIANAGHSRDPGQIAEVLALASGRLTNERDPVREEALSAVADLPAPALVAALAIRASAGGRAGSASLERLCLDGLRARDCSHATRDTIRTLAVTLLSSATDERAADGAATTDVPADAVGATALRTAVHLVEALTAHTGAVRLGGLGTLLRGGGAGAVLGAIGPWLDRAAASGDVAPLLALVRSAGRRAYRIPDLQKRLEQALSDCPDGVFGEVAVAWLADPASRGDRVAQLLAREPSAAFVPQVLAVLAAERTDLLDRALLGTPLPGGRFPAAGAPRPLPPFRYADRWLPRQQEAAVRLAATVIADPGRGLDERAALLRAVAPVPEHGRALLQRYTAPVPSTPGRERAADPSTDDVGSPLTAAALDAAAHTDDPASALGALLDHAGDDRAAAAWSAAARAAAHARPTRVAALLHDALTRETGVKVTVRKAAARLAARHLPPGAATALLSTVGRTPGIHRDVHATVVGLAATLLPDERMWALLESAVADGPEAARNAVLDLSPAELAPAHRSRYGELVARLAFAPEELTANQALYGLRDWAPYTPAAGSALADVYTDLASPLSVYRAGYALTELAQSGLPHPIGGAAPGSFLHDVVDRLLALIAAGEPEGGGRDGDLPARRRLDSLFSSTIRDPRTCAVLARQLAAEPAVTATRTALLVRAVDLAAAEPELLLSLRELTAAIEGRPVLAARVAEDVEEAHRYGRPLADPAAVLTAISVLSGDGGLVEGLLAVGLAAALGARLDWPERCRTALVELRRHPELEVREAAYATVLGGG
ncbi:hypothetical protein [Streptomyces sp. NBC_00572]|uniref:hypothetical protein n=1 Tax=Streptomyces sp. NBC_00572 TaxID=2903664 RepID=UPI00224FC6D9|nr:hypothetical protein [Streptomyces sp. NBC_00572]MCX4985109.1 hypothetical protein [Streptomyces sp. NBC_00572]